MVFSFLMLLSVHSKFLVIAVVIIVVVVVIIIIIIIIIILKALKVTSFQYLKNEVRNGVHYPMQIKI